MATREAAWKMPEIESRRREQGRVEQTAVDDRLRQAPIIITWLRWQPTALPRISLVR